MHAMVTIQVRKTSLLKRRYEFCLDEQVIAGLYYEKSYSYKATAVAGNREWQISRNGFWKSFLDISSEQSPYTKLHLPYRGNYELTVSNEDGRQYFLKRTGIFKETWTWFDERKEPVIELRSNKLSHKKRGQVLLHQQPKESFYLLMLIGWFLIVRYEDAVGGSG